jgi:hypothetical protein
LQFVLFGLRASEIELREKLEARRKRGFWRDLRDKQDFLTTDFTDQHRFFYHEGHEAHEGGFGVPTCRDYGKIPRASARNTFLCESRRIFPGVLSSTPKIAKDDFYIQDKRREKKGGK